MGGGSGGGGGMIRTVRRVVGGAPPEPFSPSTNTTTTIASANSRKAKNFDRNRPTSPNTALTLSSSSSANGSGSSNNGTSAFSSMINFPTSGAAAPSWGASPAPHDSEWECVDASEDGRASVFYEDLVFGTVPSRDEVQHAVSALQQYAFSWSVVHLNLLIQRMVVSLSSDKAVWDAVLNNEMVKELRGSITQADNLLGESPDKDRDGSSPVKDILSWVLIHAKAKMMQLINTITKLVNEAFHPQNGEKKGENTDGLEGKLKTSLFLSIVVLLIVVITRVQNA
ncbi:UNVERIFIED_CONTAM: hypothetical protein Sradi_1946000 [Sesamum radiatum]|uniref:Uncharacterized protein n=1 Tax=Sesamum radiatum TaxID=300843 RepID=A0AAW2TEI7_SESRA